MQSTASQYFCVSHRQKEFDSEYKQGSGYDLPQIAGGRAEMFQVLLFQLEAIQRWSAMSCVTLNFDLSKIPFVRF